MKEALKRSRRGREDGGVRSWSRIWTPHDFPDHDADDAGREFVSSDREMYSTKEKLDQREMYLLGRSRARHQLASSWAQVKKSLAPGRHHLGARGPGGAPGCLGVGEEVEWSAWMPGRGRGGGVERLDSWAWERRWSAAPGRRRWRWRWGRRWGWGRRWRWRRRRWRAEAEVEDGRGRRR